MPKMLILYYSSYGHIETMANAIAEGARETGVLLIRPPSCFADLA